jgi:hypothetical protein
MAWADVVAKIKFWGPDGTPSTRAASFFPQTYTLLNGQTGVADFATRVASRAGAEARR